MNKMFLVIELCPSHECGHEISSFENYDDALYCYNEAIRYKNLSREDFLKEKGFGYKQPEDVALCQAIDWEGQF